jgi:hypothetical protein
MRERERERDERKKSFGRKKMISRGLLAKILKTFSAAECCTSRVTT